MFPIDIEHAQVLLPDLIEDAVAGKDIVISERGEPRVRLVPIARRADRHWVVDECEALPDGDARFRTTAGRRRRELV